MAVAIIYASLDNAAENFSKAAEQCKKYAKGVNSVVKTLNSLPGTDSNGYVSSALKLAREKAEAATELESRCKVISQKIVNFKDYAKQQDKCASDSISSTIDGVVGERGFFQKIGDWIHDTYVNFLDRLESLGPVGKLLAQGIRKTVDWAGDATRKAINWFKYGNGKYVLNILDSLKDVLVAVGVVVAALAAAVFTGPIWLTALSIVAIGSACVYLTCQLVDSSKQMDANTKALSLSKDGNITAARYYGEIDGYSSDIEHHDYGDEKDNALMETIGDSFDKTKTISKVTATVSTAFVSFASLGLQNSASGETVVDFNRAFEAQKYKMLHDAGFNSNDLQTGGFDSKTAFNPLDKFFKTKNTKSIDRIMGGSNSTATKVFGYTLDYAKWASNGEKVVKGINTLSSGKVNYDTVEGVMDIVGFIPIIDSFTDQGWKIIDNGKKIIVDVILK